MYEYRFERVGNRRDSRAYQTLIAELAAQGWRLVQVMHEMPASASREVVVILERDAAERALPAPDGAMADAV